MYMLHVPCGTVAPLLALEEPSGRSHLAAGRGACARPCSCIVVFSVDGAVGLRARVCRS